jgi:hypothetical protein
VFVERHLDKKIPWNSVEVGKDLRGGGGKGDFEGYIVELCNCGWQTHPSHGGDEECSSLLWRNVDHNIH